MADEAKEQTPHSTSLNTEPTDAREPAVDDLDIVEPDDDSPPDFQGDVGKEEKPEPEETTRDDSAFPRELLDMAKDLGLSEEDAKAFGDPARLAKVLRAALGKANAAPPPAETTPERTEPTAPSKTEPPTGAKAPVDPLKAFESKLDKEAWDPELVDFLERLVEHNNARFEHLQKQYTEAANYVRTQQQQAFVQWFDEEIDKLGPSYEEIFGKGRSQSLGMDNPHFLNRKKIADAMDTIRNGLLARDPNARVPDLPELFRRALAMEFSDHIDKATRRKIGQSLSKREGQFIPRASGRNGKTTDPIRSATQKVAQMLRDQGLDVEPEEEFD